MTYEEAKKRIKCILKNNYFTLSDKNALNLGIKALEKLIEMDKARFTHICKSDRDIYPNEFSIYARVIKTTEYSVTIERFQKFGCLPVGKVTLSSEDFDKYYKEIMDESI